MLHSPTIPMWRMTFKAVDRNLKYLRGTKLLSKRRRPFPLAELDCSRAVPSKYVAPDGLEISARPPGSRFDSVCDGATTMESPVCTPSGSKFSMLQTVMQLSRTSRTTSYLRPIESHDETAVRFAFGAETLRASDAEPPLGNGVREDAGVLSEDGETPIIFAASAYVPVSRRTPSPLGRSGLDLLPAPQVLVDQDLLRRRRAALERAHREVFQLRVVLGEARAQPAERERGPDQHRVADLVRGLERALHRRRRVGKGERLVDLPELRRKDLAVLGRDDGVDLRTCAFALACGTRATPARRPRRASARTGATPAGGRRASSSFAERETIATPAAAPSTRTPRFCKSWLFQSSMPTLSAVCPPMETMMPSMFFSLSRMRRTFSAVTGSK